MQKDRFGALSDCENRHDITIKEKMMIAAEMIGEKKKLKIPA